MSYTCYNDLTEYVENCADALQYILKSHWATKLTSDVPTDVSKKTLNIINLTVDACTSKEFQRLDLYMVNNVGVRKYKKKCKRQKTCQNLFGQC